MLSKALEPARRNPSTGRYSVCAIARDKQGNVLSVGFNSYEKTHPLQARTAAKANQPGKIYLHAEIAALVKSRGMVYSLSVARITKDGRPALAEPCPVCRLAMKEAGVEKIEWTTGVLP